MNFAACGWFADIVDRLSAGFDRFLLDEQPPRNLRNELRL
jgi:hypothetical protein